MFKLFLWSFLFLFFGLNGLKAQVQFKDADSQKVREIFDVVLANGEAYENLRTLCKDIGHRLSGSPQAEMAVRWGKELMEQYQPDKVYLQEIEVPHWERGTKETAWMKSKSDGRKKLDILALGGSIPTDGLLKGEVIEVHSFEDMEEKQQQIKGKIVFFNRAFDPKLINTFEAYGACAAQRWNSAKVGGQYGAKAVVIRSLTHHTDDHPHTGSMYYEEGTPKIPAAAMSTASADRLEEALRKGKVNLEMQLNCINHGMKKSHNVIAEITGTENPDNIMVVGGHLDSWDVGEGAHDDGAGIVHSIELLHVFRELQIKPKNTLRIVLFMNEENGNMGGKTYADLTEGENHILAIESDRGGFSPRGFAVEGSEQQVAFVQAFEKILSPYFLHYFEAGYSGVDIRPLRDYHEGILMLGLVPDSQRYFDYHHSENDVFESVHKRELEMGCGAMAAMLYLLDQHYESLSSFEMDEGSSKY